MSLLPPRPRRCAAGVLLAIAGLCAFHGAGEASAREPEPIAWRDDYGSALDEAKASNRLLWIQFTGPWCPNCTRMDRDSLPHPAVVQHARESFVPLKLRSDVHEQLALSFNLSAVPATIIVAPSREVIALHQGYLGPAEFDAFLRDCLARMPGTKAVQKEDPDSPAAAKPASGHSETTDRLALRGYCPVSLIRDRKLVLGQSEHSLDHDGLTYRFASEAMKNTFRDQPDRYTPANKGACPVAQLDLGKVQRGDPKWGILYHSHLFLFASDDARKRFALDPNRYAMVDVAEQGFCVHCIRESGLLVRGDSQFEATVEGRRYWFPDLSHRDAFLESSRR